MCVGLVAGLPPHPGLLPQGGEGVGSAGCSRTRVSFRLPLPIGGEGRGEGSGGAPTNAAPRHPSPLSEGEREWAALLLQFLPPRVTGVQLVPVLDVVLVLLPAEKHFAAAEDRGEI